MRTLSNLLHRWHRGDHPERRVGFSPVPNGIEYILTDEQASCLKGQRYPSWSLAFVRSEGLVEPLVVMMDDVDNQYGILADDGIIYYDSRLKCRMHGLVAGD